MKMFRPRTKLGRTVLWSAGLTLLCRILHFNFFGVCFTIVFLFTAAILSSGWARRRILWRLRRRLIVTFVFIGVVPIALLLIMAAVSGYIFAGQFATYVASSHLQTEQHHLDTSNAALAGQFSALDRNGKLTDQIARDLASVSGGTFPNRTITLWRKGKPLVVFPTDASAKAVPVSIPEKLPAEYEGVAIDQGGLYLRAMKHDDRDSGMTVISSAPITAELMKPATSRLGSVTLIRPRWNSQGDLPATPGADDSKLKTTSSGELPPATDVFDRTVRFYTLLKAVDWQTGEARNGAIGVVTRPSILYKTLFAALGDNVKVFKYGLIGLGIFFGLIELIALIIGLLLSRSITHSVALLYGATEHVNRGDLTHRIRVRGRDQMAALESSFNNMTDSLVVLLAEQKEKQRLESELAIAQQVQDLLFPHKSKEFSALEVYGFCRPARSVSGDYYDFIPTGADSLMLAVGDISGKGISAALLMATVHAFVRAYSLEPGNVSGASGPLPGLSDGDPSMYYRGGGGTDSAQLAPGMLMTTLNYQLFHCTPPEKYATMFLGCYDAASQQLTYCNAGHLPPMLVRADGTVFRLAVSGTVVGLFDGATYEKSSIGMQPGDLFVAFSDGVTEPENDRGEFGEDRLIEILREHRSQPLPRISELIISAVTDWIGHAEQPDDVTVVLARAR